VLRYRATSVATDEALCLTTLAQLDMEQILNVEPAQRMKKFWELLPIPAKIVFRTGDTIDEDGWRWAPRSLLSSQEMRGIDAANTDIAVLFGYTDEPIPTYLEDFEPTSFDIFQESTPLAIRSLGGLHFQCSGILLGPWMTSLGQGLFIRDQHRRYYFVGCNVEQTAQVKDPANERGEELALILEKDVDELISDMGKSVDSTTALVVSIRKGENDVIYTDIESVGFISPYVDITEEEQEGIGIIEHCEAILESSLAMQDGRIDEPDGDRGQEEVSSSSAALPAPANTPDMIVVDGSHLQVAKNGDRIMIVKDGQHFFFEGCLTPATQMWCVG
jgi:hypothetical protein